MIKTKQENVPYSENSYYFRNYNEKAVKNLIISALIRNYDKILYFENI